MSGLFGGAQKATVSPTRAMGIDFQGAQYGNVVPVVYGRNKVTGNCIWYGDFRATAQQQKSGKGGGGGGTTNYTYSASAQMGLCEGPGISLVTVYSGTSIVDLSSINYAFASGAKGQAPWSHLTGSAALGYSLTAVFSFQNLALGSSATLPNYNYEVNGLKPYGGSVVDANPRDIATDICSDPYHGINFPWLGDLTQYSNYCVANSLFLSPVYDQQQSAQQTLSDLFKYTNAYAYYSDDQLKVVPLGDVAVTGNGVTYTPNVTPLVDLDDTDFLVDGAGDVPVQLTRKAPQDSMNVVRVDFTDRSNSYHDSMIPGTIDFDIVANGERSDTSETVNGCTTAAVARFIAQNLVQRAFYVRNTYTFKLPWNYCYLEPTDIVTLTDASLGLNKFPVRITSVEEDGGSVLTIEAEEFPEGIGHSAVYGTQANGGTNVDQNADPGAVNAPYLFRGPGFLVGNNSPEIWCACNGSGAMWGAAEVHLSHDGTSYTYCGTIASQARYGALTTSLPAGSADPDTTNTPSVQLYAPAQLLGGSQADADNFVTLAMVDTEVIAYENAALTGTNTYQIGYLRRGGYGSGNAAHSSGAPFVRLDDSIFRMPVDASLIGQTVYLKFLSLNVFGRTPRTLADETAYTYVVGTNVELPDVPGVPGSFSVQGVADGVSITWSNANPAAVGCTSIEFATASGGPWTVLAQEGPTTTAFHHSFTTGATYYYRARARGPLVQSGWSAYTDTFSSTGVDVSAIAATANAANSNTPLVINPNFTTQDSTGWTPDAAGWTFNQSGGSPNAAIPTYAQFFNGPTATACRNKACVPCQAGDVFAASCQILGDSGTGYALAKIYWYNASSAEISETDGNHITLNGNGTSRAVGVAPAGAVFCVAAIAVNGYTTGGSGGAYHFTGVTLTKQPSTVDETPDGVTYAKVAGSNLTSGNVDLAKSVAGKNLGNIADGGGRFGVHAVDSNNLALIDFSQAGHVNKNLGNVPDSATRFAAVEAGADKTAGKSLTVLTDRNLDNISDTSSFTRIAAMAGTPGAVQIDNANFQLAWNIGWAANGATAFTQSASPAPAFGAQYVVVDTTGGANTGILTTRKYNCNPGDKISVGALLYAASGTAAVSAAFFQSNGTFISNVVATSALAAWTSVTQNGVVPANAAYFVLSIFNTAASSFTGCNYIWCSINDVRQPNSAKAYADFSDNTSGGHVGKHLDNVGDGPSGNRSAIGNADIFVSGGINRVGLRVAGSGHRPGDMHNSLQRAVTNVPASVPASPSYSATAGSPATATISVPAFVAQAGSASTSYNSSSVSVTGTGGTTVTYFLYFNDPGFSGGTQTLNATTNGATIYAGDGYVYVGSIAVTFPTSGGGSGGGTGGGGACVTVGSFGPGARFDADTAEVMTPDGPAKVRRAIVSRQKCVRVECENGAVLECSEDAPLMTPRGRVHAVYALGRKVQTSTGRSRVVSVTRIGIREIVAIDAGDVAFYAGASKDGPFILHHNKIIP